MICKENGFSIVTIWKHRGVENGRKREWNGRGQSLRHMKEGRAPIKKNLILGKYKLIKRQSLEKYKKAKDWTSGKLEKLEN